MERHTLSLRSQKKKFKKNFVTVHFLFCSITHCVGDSSDLSAIRCKILYYNNLWIA